MNKIKSFVLLLCLPIVTFNSFAQQTDSLNGYTYSEIVKLSNLIDELEKKDSLIGRRRYSGQSYSSFTGMSDKAKKAQTILLGLNDDSLHFFSGGEVIQLSDYIFELERRDSIRKAMAIAEAELEKKSLQNFKSVIYFENNSSFLNDIDYKALDDIVAVLKAQKHLNFKLEGYTDSVGTAHYNKWLSVRRVETIRKYLEKEGLDGNRLKSGEGLGSIKYLTDNSTEEGRAKNRSVVLTIIPIVSRSEK